MEDEDELLEELISQAMLMDSSVKEPELEDEEVLLELTEDEDEEGEMLLEELISHSVSYEIL